MSTEIRALLSESDTLHQEIIADTMERSGMCVDVADSCARTIGMIEKGE